MRIKLRLRLLARLVDLHGDLERLAAAAKAGAAHRRGAEIIEPDRHPHMGLGRADAVGGIEADPAEVLDMGLRPGVAGLLRGDAVGAVEMAADIARRNAELARGGDEDVGEVLADAAPQREGFRRGGRDVGRVGVEGDLAIERASSARAAAQAYRRRLPARALSANSTIAASGCVSAVSRRNSAGGKRSTAPVTTPLVSCVSTSPSTTTANSLNGPSAVKEWVMLPKASSCWCSRQSCDRSMRQSTTYWPSWLRGVRRSICVTAVGGVS